MKLHSNQFYGEEVDKKNYQNAQIKRHKAKAYKKRKEEHYIGCVNKINHLIQNIRKEHCDVLQRIFPGTLEEDTTEEGIPLKQLKPIVLIKDTFATKQTLGQLTQRLTDVSIIAIRRGKNYYSYPKPDFKLKPNDVLILYGNAENLEKAEDIFFS